MESTETTEAFIREAIKLGWAVPVSDMERFGLPLPGNYYIDSDNIARRGNDWTQATADPTGGPPPTEKPFPNNKRTLRHHAGTMLFAVVALGVAGWLVYAKLQDSKVASAQEKQRADRIQQSRGAVVTAAKRYGAITDWDEKFRHSLSEPFTIQLEDALIPKDDKPIVVRGFLEDVVRHDGKYYLHLNAWDVGSSTVRFILECDSATADKVTDKQTSWGSISVIAQVSSVEKAALALKSGVKATEDPAPIEIDSSSLFIVRGKCLEFIPSTD